MLRWLGFPFGRVAGVLAGLLILASVATAQVGSTTDILTGTIRGPDGQPLAGALVTALSLETQLTREAKTSARGRYTIVFPDGGGQYRLTVRYIGYPVTQLSVIRQADEDRLVTDVAMTTQPIELEPVTVRARRGPPAQGRPTPGETGQNLNPEVMERMPLDASDLNVLATLAPGVVGLGSTDSTDAAFSVAGLRPTANEVTLDGLQFGSGSVPQDGIRSTRVITSTYDVARGEFSGGLVASTTRGGTNTPAGSWTYTLRDQSLSWGPGASSPFTQGYTQQQFGGGFGGPLIHDKLFGFVALQGRWRTQPLPSIMSADAATLARLGLSPDSVAHYLNILGNLGVPLGAPAVSADKGTTLDNALARFDWMISNTQTLMLRGDWRLNSLDPSGVGALALPQNGGERSGWSGGVMATLTSYFGNGFINEFRGYLSTNQNSSTPFVVGPDGRVQISSPLADTALATNTLTFGGNGGMPQQTNQTAFEGTDEISRLFGTSHRVKFGLFTRLTSINDEIMPNANGTFTYSSLGALAADSPSVFTRTLLAPTEAGTAQEGALYLGDTWRPRPGLQLTYGARLEGSRFEGAPALNAAVDSAFDVQTDAIPSDVEVTPRVGFTWFSGGSNGFLARTVITGGGGEFRSPTPTTLYTSALAAPGVSSVQAQLYCVGAGVPTPDWGTLLQDPSNIPTTCTAAAPTATAAALPTVVTFAPNFAAPRTWRGSLGIQQRVGVYTVSLSGNFTEGVSQYAFQDLNLGSAQFTLPAEDNRPVYVPAASIVPSTGAVPFDLSRLDPAFGSVLEINSALRSEAGQGILSVSGTTSHGAVFQVSYTYTRARDQSSFSSGSALQGFAAATTSGNPNVAEWATSDYERRHSFLATLTYPISGAFEVTVIGRLMSGMPFTPIVGQDINGDGARNDRAFLFNPATTADTSVANGMQRLLTSGPGWVRSCLQGLGSIAGRNSCTGPWEPSLDFQINWRPSFFNLNRRLTLSLVTINLLAGVDQLLHGANNLQGWGIASPPNPVLLNVTGFDPVSQGFLYTVNGRFGATGGNSPTLVPFQIGLQGHLAIGPDPTRDRLNALFGGGRGGGGGGGGAGGGQNAFMARFARALPNPLRDILALHDSLALSSDQTTRLLEIADSLDTHNRVVADSVQAAIERAGSNPDPAVLFAAIRPKLAAGREAVRKALNEARAVLTAAQWAKLPDSIRNPQQRGRRPPD